MTHEQKEHIIDMLEMLKNSTQEVDVLQSMCKYEKCIESAGDYDGIEAALIDLGANLIRALGNETHAQIATANDFLWRHADELIDFVRAIPET